MKRSITALSVLVFCGSFAAAKPATEKQRPSEPPVADRVIGSGDWESRRDGRGKRDWQLQIERLDDGSLAGRIHVVGSEAVAEARVEGRVEGDEVYGVLVAADDHQIGTFTGRIFEEGASGTYTFENGDSGHWSWSDPAARALKAKRAEAAPPKFRK